MASIFLSFLSVFLITCVHVTAFNSSVVNIKLAETDSQFVGEFPRTAINITLNISSPANLSHSLEQCADAGHSFLFVQNSTILGCGTLLWTDKDNTSYNGTLNNISVISTLSISPSGTIISLPDRNISSTIQPSRVIVFNMTTSLVSLESTLMNGGFISTIITSLDSTLSTNQLSNSIVHVSNSSAPLNGSQTNGDSNGTMILAPHSTLPTTLPSSNGMTNSPSGTIISLPDRNISSTIQPSRVIVFNMTTSLVSLESTLMNGGFISTIITSLDSTLSTNQLSNGIVHVSNSSAPLNGSQTNGDSNGTMILAPHSTLSTTLQSSNGMTNSPSGTIISLPDRNISSTIQPSRVIVFNMTSSLVSLENTLMNGGFNGTIITSLADTLSTNQLSNSIVHVSNSSAPLNGSQTNGDSNGTMILAPHSTLPTTLQSSNGMTNSSVQVLTPTNSLQIAKTISPSNTRVNIPMPDSISYGISDGTFLSSPNYSVPTTQVISPTNITYTSYLLSNGTVSSEAQISPSSATVSMNTTMAPSGVLVNVTNTLLTSTGNSSVGNGVFNGTMWLSGTFLESTTIQLSSSMVSVTSSLLPSKVTVSDDAVNVTKTTSQNDTYSVTMTIQPSTTMLLYNPNSSQIRSDVISNTSSVVPNANSNITTECNNSSCNNFSMEKLTELVKAYKTEMYSEVLVSVFTSINHTILVDSSGNLSTSCSVCNFIPGDKTPDVLVQSQVSSVSFSHRYLKPGRYRSRIRCERNGTSLVDVSRRVVVSLRVVNYGLICPSLLETNVTYQCVFYVNQASNLNVKFAIGSDFEKVHRFSETPLKNISADKDLSNNISLGLYSPMVIFETTLYVRCVEFVSNISGTVNLKIFRPVITLGFFREPVGIASCQTSTSNSSSGLTVCFRGLTRILRNSLINPTAEYTAVHNINITVVSGNNFIVLPRADEFQAEPGDVLGYINEQPEIPNSFTFNISSNATSTPVPQSQTNTTSSYNMFEKFSMYGFVPYEARISMRIMNPGALPLSITITELESMVADYSHIITIQRPVDGLKFNYKAYIEIGTPRVIGFELSRGTNASCDWLFTGNEVDMNGSVHYATQSVNDTTQKNTTNADDFEGLKTSFQYPHDVADDIVFLVNCSNTVSALTENVTISVRRHVFDFKASLRSASFAYTHAQTSWTSRAKGDHVGYKWVIDQKNYHTADVSMNFTRSNLPGNKTRVVVKAWNIVSKETLTLLVHVLKNPLNIQFLPALTVASNENVTIAPILNWSPYSNGTALYKDYGINISEPLQKFIAFPAFRVKVDDSLVSGNTSNGTLLTYKFPKAGSKGVNHDVRIEAFDHPEMNRMIEVLVIDRVDGLRIKSNCSDVVHVNETCVFTPEFDGSDVSCNWTVSFWASEKICELTYEFDELGNFTVTVDVRNQISSQKVVYNINVVADASTKSEFGITTTSKISLPTQSISPSRVIVSTVNFPVSFTQGQATISINSNSIISFLEAGPSSRSIRSLALKSPSLSTLLNGITTSSSQAGLSSRIINPGSQSLKIIGPHFFAVGQMVTFYAFNVASSVELSWFVDDTRLNTTNNNMSYVFNHPGEFEIIVNSSSTNQASRFTVTVQEPISGFQVFFHQNALSKRIDILFVIGSGTNVSYSISLGDGSQTRTGTVREFGKNISVHHLYAETGYYNLSVTVSSSVGPNKTENARIFVNDTCKLQEAILYGASQDIQYPRQISGNSDIVMALKPILDCTNVPQLKYSWKVERLSSGIPNGVVTELASTHEATFKFPGNNISTGQYKIQVIVENPMDGLNLTRIGYFSKILESIFIRIACGTARLFSVSEQLTITASVIAGSNSVEYEWFCDGAYNVACFKDEIRRNTSVVQFPGNYFKAGDVYEFVVQVKDGDEQGVTSQKVTFGFANETLDLCVSSSQENEDSIVHTKDTKIIPVCPRCSSVPDLAWSWRVLKILSHLNSTTRSDVENLILNANELFLPANTLQSNTLYKIQLNATSYASNVRGYLSYELRTNDVPRRGFCDIKSYESTTLLNAFQTSCHAWYDRDQPLEYEFWYSIDGLKYSLFYHGKHPASGMTFFKTGLPERDYMISVKVIIGDAWRESTVRFLTIKNFPLPDHKIEEFFKSSQSMEKQVENLINNSNVQGAIQYLSTVSSVLNEKWNGTEKRGERIKVREQILNNLKKLCCSNSVETKQTIEATLSVVSVPSELSLAAQLHASSIYLNITQSLHLVTEKKELQKAAEKVATGISLLMSDVRLLSNGTTSDNITQMNNINKASLLAVNNLGDSLLNQTKPGEPAIVLSTSVFTLAVQKHTTAEFPGTRLSMPDSITEFVVPKKMKSITGPDVSTKVMSMSHSPFLLQNSSHHTTPNTAVASFVLLDNQGNELQMNNLLEPFHIFLERHDSSQDLLSSNSTQSSAKYTSTLTEDSDPDLYEINMTESNQVILVTSSQISAQDKGQLRMRIHKANQSYPTGREFIVSTTSSLPVSMTWRELQGRGTYYVSIEFRSLSFRKAGKANRVEYSVSFRQISCNYWNVSRQRWKSNGCKVGLRSTTKSTHCECNHLTWFGSRVVVPPNSISFSKIAERIKDPRNYITIMSVLCSIFVLYCLVLVWARRHDIKDGKKNGITWCPSNHVTDSHQYQVIVYTGIRRNAGTTANVGLMLSGELGKSRKCLLKSSKREVLKRGNVDSFLITTTGSLGPLDYLHIWHDNTGSDPAWFLNRVVVRDSETGRTENFLCYRWLAVDEGDGQIQRLLPIANAEDLKRFRHLFVSRATSELTDAHLWFSVKFRPLSSPFTRVQRVSCCLTLLLTSMMANAMWYEREGTGNGSQINLGLFTFSWDELFIGVCSSLIVFPLNLLLVQIFRRSRSKGRISARRRPSFVPTQKIKPAFFDVPIRESRDGSSATRDGTPALSPLMMTSPRQKTSKGCQKTSDYSYTIVSNRDSPDGARSVTSLLSQIYSSTQQANRFKDKNMLPHWCQYLGWIGVFVICLTSSAVTFMYAIEFGEQKTRKWLLSLTISLINDVFIAQPSKVLLVTVVLAYILKRPLKERYASDDVIQQEALETASTQETEFEAPDFNQCTSDEFLRAAREKREKDRFMYGLMKNVSSHLCFTVLVLIIAYGQRDIMGYRLTATQENTFVYQNFKEISLKKQSYGFFQVANVEDFWRWNKAILVPGISNVQWYNYSSEWSTFTSNFGGFLFGAARMRQKRLKKDVCSVLPNFKDIVPSCSGNYKSSREDKAGYENSWNKPSGNENLCNTNDGTTLLPDHWCFTCLSGLITAPYVGWLATYSGGGYSQDFDQNYKATLNRTRELQEHQWIDKYTRAVFVEFTLYNPNVNLFSIVTLIFEISSSGDFNPGTNFLSIRLYNYLGNFQIFVLICQLLFLGFVCVYTYDSAKVVFGRKKRTLSKAWTVYEIVVVLISWLAVAIYFVAIVFRKRILEEFRKDPTKFTSFRHSASWQMSLEYVIAALVFMVSLKFIRLFQFNRRMFLLPLTLSNTASALLSYSVVFSIVLLAFSLLFHLMLHAYNSNFVNMLVTIETLLHVLQGKSDVLVKRHQFPVLERLVIFVYMCLMKFILLNIFVVILNDGFSRAQAKTDMEKNAFEFFDFVKGTVNELLGIRRLNVAKKISVSSEKSQRAKDKKSMNNVECMLKKLETKVEKMLNMVQRDSFDDSSGDDILEDLDFYLGTV